MNSTDPAARQDYISGLRHLADYLDTHPDVPVPEYGTEILVCVRDAEDGGITDVIDAYAALEGFLRQTDDGGLETWQAFGPVGYKVYTLTKARIARHRAASTYYGSVIPDSQAVGDA